MCLGESYSEEKLKGAENEWIMKKTQQGTTVEITSCWTLETKKKKKHCDITMTPVL